MNISNFFKSESKSIFFIKFIIISTLLFLLYIPLAYSLFSLTISFANFIMSLFGYKLSLSVVENADLSDVLININILAYVALVISTPVERSKKLYFLIFGILVLFFINSLFIASDTIFSYDSKNIFAFLSVMFFGTFGQVFFPFIFWIILAHKWLFKNFLLISSCNQ